MSATATVIGLVTAWLQGRGARKQQEHEQELAEIKAGNRDNDRVLRRGSFFLLSFPFVWGYFDPEGITAYFLVIKESMPGWYVEVYITVLFGIWGISTGKNVLLGVIRAWKRK